MKRYLQILVLAAAFDVYWLAVVLFRERGQALWLALAILAFILLLSTHRLYALLLAAVGCGLDAVWVLTGIIRFNGEVLLPLWMVALWLMFAVVWTRLSCTTTLPGWMLVLLATCGGPIAYWIGERLGAITFLQPTLIVVSLMATGWLGLMLFFHTLMGRRQ